MRGSITKATLVACAICVILLGCSVNGGSKPNAADLQTGEEGPVSLTILTEPTTWNQTYELITRDNKSQVNRNLRDIISYYESENPDVSIEVEMLPSSTDNRSNIIAQKRIAMMAGDTPDIYLLPTISTDEINVSGSGRQDYEPLFRDVAQAQTNHWFADISSYYDSDKDLHTKELQQTVMDAGRVGDARYILPLGYSFDVLVADQAALSDMDIDSKELSSSVLSLFDGLIALKDDKWLPDLFFGSIPLNYLPNLCDYETETACLQEEDLYALLGRLNKTYFPQIEYLMSIDQTKFAASESYLLDPHNVPLINDVTPVRIDSLSAIMKYLPTAKSNRMSLDIIPVTATDGGLVADITYWGAVGADCKNVKTAYDFLRTLLLPQVQHGEDLVGAKTYHTAFSDTVAPGWPVRYKGFAEKSWKRIHSSIEAMERCVESRKEALLNTDITDADLPVLNYPISYARFPSVLDQDFFEAVSPMWDGPMSEDELHIMASDFIRNLEYHLAEG